MDAGAAGRHRAARGRWRCSAIRSPPTTSRRPARSSRTARPAATCCERQVSRGEFNSYGSRRGNHEVMMRGTFANIRIRNRMLDNVEGGFTRYAPTGETMPIYDAAMLYKQDGRPLVVIAGKEYGTGSSRDWAAKGTVLLGVRAVHRRKLRAHPPLEPGRHGRASAAVPRRRERRDARASTAPRSTRSPASRELKPRQDVDGAGHARTTAASSASPRAAASIPTTSSNISARAASCTTCCGGWRRRERRWSATCHCGRCAHHPAAQARPSHSLQLQPVQHRPASGASITRPTSCAIEGELRSATSAPMRTWRCTCSTSLPPFRHAVTHWVPLTDPPHERMGVIRSPGSIPACSTVSPVKQVDGRSWPA